MRITDIPGVMHLWKYENIYLSGQPAPGSWEHIKNLGVKTIVNARWDFEADFSEQDKIVKELGINYVNIPVVDVRNGQLIPENCEKLSQLIKDGEDIYIHCGTANRIAAWLMTYLPKYKNMDFEKAVEVAQENGLSNPGFIGQAEAIANR